MIAKLYLLFLSSALLGECALGGIHKHKVISTTTTTTTPSTTAATTATTTTVPPATTPTQLKPINELPEATFFDRLRVLILVVQDFLPMTSSSLSTGAQLLTNAVEDLLSNTDNRSEELIKKINEITDFASEIDDFLTIETFPSTAYVELFEKLVHKITSLNATTLENPSDEDLLIDAALQKYDLKLIKQKLYHFYDTYLEQLQKKFKVVEKELPGKELATDEGLKTWMSKTEIFINWLAKILDYLKTNV